MIINIPSGNTTNTKTDGYHIRRLAIDHHMRRLDAALDVAVLTDTHQAVLRLDVANNATIDLHRAIANSRNISLEHSVLIVSAKGASFEQGIVLDPWRQGMGRLWWSKTLEDPRYHWDSREEVFAWKREWQARVAEGR